MNKRNKDAGFSLIELMVTVLVVAILVSIAIPAYQSSVRKARRTEARSALVDLQAREERYFSTNPSQGYTKLAAELGYAASAATTDLSATALPLGTSGFYTVQITSGPTAPTTSSPGLYTLTATAVGEQLKDLDCRSITLDQSGQQGASDASGTTSTAIIQNCWK